MKCDELQYSFLGDCFMYPADGVDEAIAELKQKLHDAEMAKDDAEAANTEYRTDIAALKAENERLKKSNVVHIEDFLSQSLELRDTKRAMWMARALALSRFDVDKYIRTHMMSNYWKCGGEIFVLACKAMQNKIDKTKEILLKKAEEYK